MIGDLKIKMVTIDGEERVPPECMRLLLELGEHRRCCEMCNASNLCVTGDALMTELLAQPEVSLQNVREPEPKKPLIELPPDFGLHN